MSELLWKAGSGDGLGSHARAQGLAEPGSRGIVCPGKELFFQVSLCLYHQLHMTCFSADCKHFGQPLSML